MESPENFGDNFVHIIPATGKKKMPRWVLAVCLVEALAAAILAVLIIIPNQIPHPTESDEDARAEQEVRALIVQAESCADKTGSTKEELLAFYESALKRATGTVWASEIKRRIGEVKEKYQKDAQEALAKLAIAFETHVAEENYGRAQTELDNFSAQFGDCVACAEQFAALKQRFNTLLEARKECYAVIEEADNLWRKERTGEALEMLSSFSVRYPDTVYAMRARMKKEEIESYLAKVAAQKEAAEKAMQEEDAEFRRRAEEEKQRLQEEAQRRWVEEEMRRLEAEAERARVEQEKQKEEEEAKAKEAEAPKQPEGDEGEPWAAVEMKHFSQKEFPFITPFPTDSALVAGPMATTTLKFLPLPAEGRKFGHGVEDIKSSIEVDADADGVFETHLSAQGGIITVKVFYGAEEGEALYTVKIFREDGAIRFRRHSFAVGKFQNTKLVLIDEDNNGKFNDKGIDALVVGNDTCACTLADVMMIGGKLFEVKVSQSGKKLSLRPFKAKTGKLNMVSGFKARANLLYAIVVGSIKDEKEREYTAAFDLAGQPKGLDIPAGVYEFHGAAVGSANKVTAQINKTRECKEIVVEESSSVKIDWGAPCRLEFSYDIDSNGELRVSPDSIRIYGAYGESYSNLSPDDFLPNVQAKDESGALVFTRSFGRTDDGKSLDIFECRVPANAKLKVRMFGRIGFLGDASSDWK